MEKQCYAIMKRLIKESEERARVQPKRYPETRFISDMIYMKLMNMVDDISIKTGVSPDEIKARIATFL